MNANPILDHQLSGQPGAYQPVLKVLGLGGGGCNAVQRMIAHELRGIDFIAANTDHQALEKNSAPHKIQLGPRVTRGLGAGGDPRVGEAAAKESAREIAAALAGADMVFLTAGMGGGTGTGSIPVAAEIARSIGAVVIAIVTTPFTFEMGRRQRNANEGLSKLNRHTNTLVAIPNDRLLFNAPRMPIETAFCLADDVLRQAVQGITELITEPGMINVDFAHVRRLIQLGGGALMAIGQGKGRDKALAAIDQALHHPLLDSVSLENAAGVIANFTGGDDMTLFEMNDALSHLRSQVGQNTDIVFGVTNNEQLHDKAQVILVITGLGAPTLEETFTGVPKMEPKAQVNADPKPNLRTLISDAHSETPARQTTQAPAVSPLPAQAPLPAVPIPVRRPATTISVGQPALPQAEYAPALQDLDIPAFMRRRNRIGG